MGSEELRDLRQEILRLRDAMHEVRTKLNELGYRYLTISEWQERFEPIIEDLREADRIADAVAKRMSKQQADFITKGSYGLNRWQTWAAIGGFVVAALALLFSTLAQVGVL